MEQINKIELQGNVGTLRINEVGDNNQVLHFSLATNYAYKSKEGNVIETTWHNVVVWKNRNMPDFKLLKKGSAVHVIGRVKTSKYTSNDGVEKQVHEVIASRLEIISDEE